MRRRNPSAIASRSWCQMADLPHCTKHTACAKPGRLSLQRTAPRTKNESHIRLGEIRNRLTSTRGRPHENASPASQWGLSRWDKKRTKVSSFRLLWKPAGHFLLSQILIYSIRQLVYGGRRRKRTAVRGFAVLCIATLPSGRRRGRDIKRDRRSVHKASCAINGLNRISQPRVAVIERIVRCVTSHYKHGVFHD